jgi:putative ABC transport system permease protein
VALSLLTRASLRHLLGHRLQTALAILGVALGVAVVVAIDLAVGSAERSFVEATEVLSGGATDRIEGGPSGLPEAVWRTVRADVGLRRAAPVVEVPGVRLVDHPQQPKFALLGLDPLAEGSLRPTLGLGNTPGLDLGAFFTRRGAVVLEAGRARELEIEVGDGLRVQLATGEAQLEVVGLLTVEDPVRRRALAGTLLADLATAQEVGGQIGRLTRIDVVLPAGASGDAVRERLRQALPAEAELVASTAPAAEVASMTGAFRTNLLALSLLALLCGLFLVANTAMFSVVQRRRQFALARCLGATRDEVLRLVLAEAALIGSLGSALGIALGVALAQALLGLVQGTVATFYLSPLGAGGLAVAPATLTKALVLGAGTTVLATLPAALDATASRPSTALSRSSVEARAARSRRRVWPVLLGLAIVGGALLVPSSLATSFAGIFALLLAYAGTIPAATAQLAKMLGRLRLPFGLKLALDGLRTSLSRTGFAIAALAVAVAVTLGITIMIASFRSTVDRWLSEVLAADLYISAPRTGATGRLDEAILAQLASLPGVDAVESVRFLEVRGRDGDVALQVLDHTVGRNPRSRLRSGDPARAWQRWMAEDAVVVSESLAWRLGLELDQPLELATDRGRVAFTVVGIIESYASDRGTATMAREVFDRHFNSRPASGAAVFAEPSTAIATLEVAVAQVVAPTGLTVSSNAGLRTASLEIFDRTFAVTGVLRTLAGVVAFIGVFAALLALQLERSRPDCGVASARPAALRGAHHGARRVCPCRHHRRPAGPTGRGPACGSDGAHRQPAFLRLDHGTRGRPDPATDCGHPCPSGRDPSRNRARSADGQRRPGGGAARGIAGYARSGSAPIRCRARASTTRVPAQASAGPSQGKRPATVVSSRPRTRARIVP